MDVFAGVVSYSDGEAFSRHEPQGFAPVADFADDRTAVTAAMHLADALRATATEARLQPLEWSLSELSENVIEHSGRREGSACAQAWKASRQAELAIADRGIGIVASLKKNARFAEYEDEDLVEIVVERGVTVAAEQGKGQGLYFISRMIEANRGELLIYSGGLMFTQRTTEKSVMRVPSPWPGTIVVARFNLDETLENTDIIGDISGEGSEYGFVEFEE
jgi:anti-sigma regulatory factor (Ser/Thr protein kinase)